MDLSDSFRELADVIDAVETSEFDVDSITSPGDTLVVEDTLTIQLSGTTPVFDDIGENSRVELGLRSADITDDGEVQIELTVRVSRSNSEQDEGPGQSDAGASDGTPVYRDPEQLRTVYESHDTFEEMRDALGADVTWNTVRRQMIKHDIHDPETTGDTDTADDTGANDPEDTDSEHSDTKSVADGGHAEATTEHSRSGLSESGIALPAGVTVDELVEILKHARTVDEVRQQLDLHNISTYRLLNDLDLIDPATGELVPNAAQELASDRHRE